MSFKDTLNERKTEVTKCNNCDKCINEEEMHFAVVFQHQEVKESQVHVHNVQIVAAYCSECQLQGTFEWQPPKETVDVKGPAVVPGWKE